MTRFLPLVVVVLLVVSCGSPVPPASPAPESAEAYLEQGEGLSGEGQYMAAIDHFSAAIDLEPDNAEAYFLRGRTHYDYACWVLREATGQGPQNVAVLPEEAAEHMEQAVEDYTRALELDPQYTRAYNNRGNARASLGEEEKALQDYDTALEMDPELSLAYFNRGLLHYRVGDYDQAIADLETYLELVPDADDRAQVEDFMERIRTEAGTGP